MSRLILFSGGVESTAMLTLASKSDIVTTVRDTSEKMYTTHHSDSVEAITKSFGLDLHYTDLRIPLAHERTSLYQLLTFINLAGLWVTRFPRITEVWYGITKDEPCTTMRSTFDHCVGVWNAQHPKVPLKFPLSHLSKQEIWDMIPEGIQPLVSNCIFESKCGQCRKCIELKNLRSNSVYSSTSH